MAMLLRPLPGALLAIVVTAAAAQAATKTIRYTDGICAYRVAYDAAKVDGAKLKATFDYLAGSENSIELPPSFATPEEIAAIDVAAYRGRCDAHRQRLAAPVFVALPGLEDLRRRDIDELETTCRRTEASLAAAKGDLAPARAHAPACTRYADLLALPVAELKAQWNDLVMDLCQTSTERNICAGELQRRGEGPGSETRRRLAVLDRWTECATKPAADTDGEKHRLRDLLAKRFKTKALSCAQ